MHYAPTKKMVASFSYWLLNCIKSSFCLKDVMVAEYMSLKKNLKNAHSKCLFTLIRWGFAILEIVSLSLSKWLDLLKGLSSRTFFPNNFFAALIFLKGPETVDFPKHYPFVGRGPEGEGACTSIRNHFLTDSGSNFW